MTNILLSYFIPLRILSRPHVFNCLIGLRSIKNSRKKVSPSNCCGRNTHNAIQTVVTATRSIARSICSGMESRSVRCDNCTKPERSVLLITAAPPYRWLMPSLEKSLPLRFLWGCSARLTTPMLKQHTRNPYQTGYKAMCACLNTSVAHLR